MRNAKEKKERKKETNKQLPLSSVAPGHRHAFLFTSAPTSFKLPSYDALLWQVHAGGRF